MFYILKYNIMILYLLNYLSDVLFVRILVIEILCWGIDRKMKNSQIKWVDKQNIGNFLIIIVYIYITCIWYCKVFNS